MRANQNKLINNKRDKDFKSIVRLSTKRVLSANREASNRRMHNIFFEYLVKYPC